MTTNQTSTSLRILTTEEYDRAYDRLTSAAYRHGSRLGDIAAHDALTETLAAIGVFTPAPDIEPFTCTARFVPNDAEQYEPDMLGVWQQCQDEPGHEGTDHDSGDLSWADDMPGALPPEATA
ncbi:hypothetical protein ACIOEX_02440 [Streptomyces sp. NPDC087850]|uniref:hypothetical protein n=1 Tax=Streptomyces sp. NPDC087850 TaxID=3365809 RepID=UPI00380598FC